MLQVQSQSLSLRLTTMEKALVDGAMVSGLTVLTTDDLMMESIVFVCMCMCMSFRDYEERREDQWQTFNTKKWDA